MQNYSLVDPAVPRAHPTDGPKCPHFMVFFSEILTKLYVGTPPEGSITPLHITQTPKSAAVSGLLLYQLVVVNCLECEVTLN